MDKLNVGDYVMLKPNSFGKRELGKIDFSKYDGWEVQIGIGFYIVYGDYYSMRDSVDEVVKKQRQYENFTVAY